jgi:CDP-paratose 2-epimerase
MNFKRILITGGAGFVGSNLATMLRQGFGDIEVTAFDNLRRRGSEMNLPRLAEHGVRFVHGDIRCREDIDECPPFDLLIDCSAEPSVQAGVSGSPMPVIQHNLAGSINCVEAARSRGAAFLFLSTSRVYPIEPVNAIPFREEPTRFVWDLSTPVPGVTPTGITEDFTLEGARSPYGATKLAVELLLREYAWLYKMPVLINRCGVLAGPWQMGKVDQGVVTLWVVSHLFDRKLKYIGFGGAGKQVRDLLHVADLYELVAAQLRDTSKWDGRAYNVGGGLAVSASLAELTTLCQETTGRRITIESDARTSPVDVRIYLTDSSRVSADYNWKPGKSVRDIVGDIAGWASQHEAALRRVLG